MKAPVRTSDVVRSIRCKEKLPGILREYHRQRGIILAGEQFKRQISTVDVQAALEGLDRKFYQKARALGLSRYRWAEAKLTGTVFQTPTPEDKAP